ncbi:ADI_G0059580.mRNA.1.CDS.1 [Saccharomyces cerevisiae]|jgi:mannosyltransferase OCH1-like enzyme|uniref:inositol phosphorylceramide mannosyltransferase n=1 Tax=Saccharomyces cerevisiae (strain AWRI1631) TaxID=545124 RepID=B5VTA4_YEAS6|nr:Sur1p [Saccharomyces cerevisiae YJM993]AJV92054.1 Sur1p [Saccharomyces cerevisiae YJM1477]AJV93193.1 Sur1p [Saccharomyces cerevisiae YJM1526]AJV99230.1 Sur1p [Saccharomyces cerevisiae YJM326]AJW00964.1 Sur1p [Saccharomyces cerevisiae YJM1381]AJW06176.1 Sur1p [Saccharomyces cerevisiae YJM1417]AJW10796.1 Sur1p [Saccharomyces cerevisiae YJM1129]AJW13421.1 Sur1p [Saccharomyces cerevisiae YJM1242]AJW13860.1 Sur1p [Saccharomyces cerevisiae YJM1244]AJW17768.1 Sur1p [Saccharomyces cerevisiae YJ
MRKELKYLICFNILLLLSIIYYTFDLLTLCIDDTVKDAILEEDLNPDAPPKPQLIPKIIHQTYKTEDIPEHWKEGRQKCLDLHPDYKYILWTDEMAYEFIKEEYPWFLDTFENYKYPIERADAIRYFILSHYGGVYIDLDDGCERKLDPLLAFPAFLRKTSPLGVSNDVMGSVPRHPFFLKALKSLKHYDKYWFIPYMTIMGSTGPLFLSVIWKQYKRWGIPKNGTVRILQPAYYKMHNYSFFSITKGSSWHLDDAKLMKALENHILSCVVTGFIFGFFILYGEFTFYCWLCSKNFSNLTKNWKLNAIKVKFVTILNSLGLRLKLSKSTSDTASATLLARQQKRLRKDSNTNIVLLKSSRKSDVYDLEKNDSSKYSLGNNSS